MMRSAWVGHDNYRHFGLTLETLVADILALDRRCFPADDLLEIGTYEQWLPIFAMFPQTWRALALDGRIVGYWQFAPLGDDDFAKVVAGELRSRDFEPSHYAPLNKPGRYCIYVVAICLDEDFRTVGNLVALMSSFVEQAAALRADGVVLDRLATHAYTEEGRRMCDVLSLTEEPDPSGRRSLYEGNLQTALARLKGRLANGQG